MRRAVLLLAELLLAAGAWGQIVPSAPIINFRLPMFNEQGFKTWEVRGSEGRYVNENRIEITALNMKVFSGDESGRIDLEISSPLAIVQPEDRVASGPSQLHVIGQGFDLFGEDWTYEHTARRVIIRRAVVVTLASGIGDILK